MIKSKWVLFLIAPILSAYVLTGCATPAQTAAAAMAGGLLGTTVAVLALTNSSLEVTVDMYGPTDAQRNEMRLNHPTALMQSINDRRQAALDPVQNPTARNMITVSNALRPVMGRIEKTITSLDKTIPLFADQTDQDSVDGLITMKAFRQAAAASVKAWKDFDSTVKANMERLDDPTVLRRLAFQLSVLRESLLKSAGSHVVTTGYINLLRLYSGIGLRTDIGTRSLTEDVRTKIKVGLEITDNPAATDAERIGIVLDALRQLLGLTSNHKATDDILHLLGISLDSQQLLTLGSRQAIVRELTPSLTGPDVCEGASAVIALPACSTVAYSYTFGFSRATADYNTGPISNEVAQVLQAANRSLTIISEPGNADRWRLSANAKSRGGAGNQNSIIYFENMALPVVKSSAFDPTKFVVAAGALYRQVFAASVAAFGAPLPATAGTPGGPDMQSSNIIATRARILNAEKVAAAARQKILDTLKMTIDQQAKVKSGDWTKNQAAIVKAVQDAVQSAASQLEAVAGTN